MAKGVTVRKTTNHKAKNVEDSLEARSKKIHKEKKVTKTPASKKYRVRIEAHRGANKVEYQNTLKAYQKAIEADADGIELDVWLTRDRIPIVTHGSNEMGLLTLGEFSRNIQDCTVAELQQLELPNGSKIPTLEEVLTFMKEQNYPISVNIEMKGHNHELVEKVVKLVTKFQAWDVCFLTSFNHSYRQTLLELTKKLKLKQKVTFGYLCTRKEHYPNFETLYVQPDDIFTLDVNMLLENATEDAKDLIAKAKAKGLRIGFYYPMKIEETDENLKKLCDAGADCLIVNDLVKTAKFLEQSAPAAV